MENSGLLGSDYSTVEEIRVDEPGVDLHGSISISYAICFFFLTTVFQYQRGHKVWSVSQFLSFAIINYPSLEP